MGEHRPGEAAQGSGFRPKARLLRLLSGPCTRQLEALPYTLFCDPG